jgi:hypothetical protein
MTDKELTELAMDLRRALYVNPHMSAVQILEYLKKARGTKPPAHTAFAQVPA